MKLIGNEACTAGEIAEIEEQYENEIVEAINLGMKHFSIRPDLVGSHGQTIFHRPKSSSRPALTWQIGRGEFISQKLRIPVVSNFRQADILKGGHGAPIMPAVESLIHGGSDQNKAYLNIGGISNINIPERKLGFDIGPGNCLIDLAVQKHFKKPFDQSGQIARSGNIDQPVLDTLLEMDYFRIKPPKSTGREYFSIDLLRRITNKFNLKSTDLVTTLSELTVRTISSAITEYASDIDTVILSGGGGLNDYIFTRLQNRFEA